MLPNAARIHTKAASIATSGVLHHKIPQIVLMVTSGITIANMRFLLLQTAMLLLLTSCLNLQIVHQFSEEALESTAEFEQIELTFQQLCEKKMMMEAIRAGAIKRNYRQGCQLQILADSAALKMQHAIVDYLKGLYLLTSNRRISYSLDPVAQVLQENALVNLEEEELGAYQKMIELIFQASTEAYRKRKTSDYVAQAQEPLGIIIDKIVFVMNESLREAAEQQREMLYFQTRELADSAHSFLEKRNLILAYASELAYYDQQFQLLDAYITILRTVKEGHQQLYEKRDQLDKDDALEILIHYTGEIRQLHSNFEKIK